MITVAETVPFRRKAEALLSPAEREDLIDYLAEHPTAGVLIQGTGGIRKLRWGAEGRGKRGGTRVIYFVGGEDMPLYLLALFVKNEKADLSMAERQELRSFVDDLKTYWRDRSGKSIH
jgi:hypothetical protein